MTGGNRSTAVMQRRAVAPDALDYFPTPPFATRALTEQLAAMGEPLEQLTVWEPACGEGYMAAALGEAFDVVRVSDIHPYGDHAIIDFPLEAHRAPPCDWIITNPPFSLAEDFIAAALGHATRGVAMLVRLSFLESEGRVAGLFRDTPPSLVLVFAERVVMLKGRLVRRGSIDPFATEAGRKASSATSYCWLVWLIDATPSASAWIRDTRLRWIPPCMERLERAGDYPAYPVATGPLFDAVGDAA